MRFLRDGEDQSGELRGDPAREIEEQGNGPASELLGHLGTSGDAAPGVSFDANRDSDITDAILDVMDALIVVLDHEGRIVMFNRACEKVTGYASNEVCGARVWDRLLPPEESVAVQEVFSSLKSGDYPNRHENNWVAKDGRHRVIAWSNTAIPKPDGSIGYIVGTGIDVTDRKAAEDGIRWRTEDLTLLNTLSESANRGDDVQTLARLMALGTRGDLSRHGAALYLLDDTGTLITRQGVNFRSDMAGKLEKLLGNRMPKTVGIRLSASTTHSGVLESGSPVVVIGEQEVTDLIAETAAASDAPPAFRKAAVAAAPAMRSLLGLNVVTILPLMSDGVPLGLLSIEGKTPLTDIQMGRLASIARQVAGIIKHRRSEEALRYSEARLAEAQRIAGIGSWTWDIARGERYWSEEIYRIIGRTRDECAPTYDGFAEAVHPKDRDRIKAALDKSLRTGRRYDVEHRVVRPDGSMRVVHERGEFSLDKSGKPTHMIGTMQDITKRKRALELQGVLLTIAEAVNGAENLTDLLRTIHGELGRLIDTTNFYVAVFDDDTGAYTLPYHIDEYDDSEPLEPMYLDKSLTDYVRRRGEPVLVDEQHYRDLMASGEIETIGAPPTVWLGVPLKSGGKDIGVVAVQSYDDVSPYTPYDLKLMSFVSDNIAMAVGRKLAEEQVTRRLHMEETISDVASGLIRHGVEETDDAIREALAGAGNLLGARHCFTWLVEPYGDDSHDTYEWCASGVPPLVYELAAVVSNCLPWISKTVTETGFVRFDRPEDIPPEAGALRHFIESTESGSMLAVPMLDSNKTIGLVGVLGPKLGARSAESVTFLRTLSAALASALERRKADSALRTSFESLRSTVDGTVDALSRLGEARDPYTAGHQQRVAEMACAIAAEMGFPEDRIEGIRVASKLHDIGKIHVPGEILSKPGALNDLEFGIIKTHPKVGYEILCAVEFPWPVAEIALQHHERLDGSGYPDGVSGEDILPEARIVAVADVVEAMCTHRPYRPALPVDAAIEELSTNRGRLYGPTAVDACLRLLRKGKLNL